MNKIDEKKIKDIIHTIGLNNNLKDDEVRKIVESQFRFTSETIKEMSLEGLTLEELGELKTNFYYKYIGKLYTNPDVIVRQLNKEVLLKKKKEDE
jgi:hypothetical protein